jgi:hypothetical protein
MNKYKLLAIALIALGFIAFAYQGITYTIREKAVDLGAVHLTTDHTRTIPLPPVVGAIALVGGIALLVLGPRRA